jgi:2-polyprenyl-3-methyl-5-hydroxy-6-metoxy-1,4-benzoquinol methylase
VNYAGKELELFRAARNWKAYCWRQAQPFLGRRVLEVGAGLGATTQSWCRHNHAEWLCLEPDEVNAAAIEKLIGNGELPAFCRARRGALAALSPSEKFDTVLYLDVLEHIADDRAEIVRAARHLENGGFLVILAPAHEWLYTPFDRAIGHHRRYTRRALATLMPESLQLVELRYLDSFGMLASLANRLILRAAQPTPAQLSFWDTKLVPLSRRLDWIFRFNLGKSVFGVWRKV